MALAFSQVTVEASPTAALAESAREMYLDRVSRAKFLRLALVSLFFVLGCVSLKLAVAPLLVFAYFLFIRSRYQLGLPDLLALWLVALPFLGPYIAVHLAGGIPDINFNRLFVLLLLYSAWSERDGAPTRLLTNGVDYALLFFVGAFLLSVGASFMIRTPLRLFLDAVLIPCVFYFMAKRCVNREDFLPKLYIAAVLALLFLGAMGAYEGLSGHDVLRWEDEQTHMEDSDDFRVNGPMGTAEHFGIVMVMLLLFVGTLKSFRSARLVRRRYLRLAALAGVVAIAYTLTRGIWLSLLAGWLVLFMRRRPVMALGLAGSAVVAWLVLQQAVLPQLFGDLWQHRIAQKKTIYARLATYNSALAMFEDHPLLGVGFGTYSEMWERYPEKYFRQYKGEDSVSMPHNLFLAILAETGLLGAVAFIAFQAQIFRRVLRLARTAQTAVEAEFAEAGIAIAVAFLVVGIGLNFTYDVGFVPKLYFLFLGVLSGMSAWPRPIWGPGTQPRA